eukprot:gene4810-6583_t
MALCVVLLWYYAQYYYYITIHRGEGPMAHRRSYNAAARGWVAVPQRRGSAE